MKRFGVQASVLVSTLAMVVGLAIVVGEVLVAGQGAAPAAPAPGAQAPAASRGRGGEPFAGQPRINALVVSGGCCHDYALQGKLLMDAVGRALPVDWTLAVQGGTGTRGMFPIYRSSTWAQGYDIVVHNECSADVTDEAYVRRITSAHRSGPPAIVVHCAMHTFRAATFDDWREFLGVTSRRHTAQHAIKVKVAGSVPAAFTGFTPDWTTPVDELYVIDKLWPGARAVASAVSPEDQQEYPLAWTHDYSGTRVFGTTLGHGNATWSDPTFQDLMVRAFKWALNRTDTPAAAPPAAR
jgi:type 1 glutamine amidotransferase